MNKNLWKQNNESKLFKYSTFWKSPTIQFDLLKAKMPWIMINEHLSQLLQDKMPLLKK